MCVFPLQEVPSANSPFVCQGGEPECLGNMIEVIAVSHFKRMNETQFVWIDRSCPPGLHRPFDWTLVPADHLLHGVGCRPPHSCPAGECLQHQTGTRRFKGSDVPVLLPQCLQLYAPSISWSTLDSCVKGGLGHRLMHANAAMTRALSPAHLHVPWVTFNGVKLF